MASMQPVMPSPSNADKDPLEHALLAWGGAALLLAITCIAYWPAMNGQFLWDDDLLITKNTLISDPNGLWPIWFSTKPIDYWPVTNTTFWLEWRVWHDHPTGYHVVSLLLHLVASLLVWGVLRRLSIGGAFLAGLLFAIHPVNAESVAWIAQQKTLLALVFFLLSILWYLKDDRLPSEQRTRGAGGPWYWLSLVAFVLGMLSKGSIATLALVLLLFVWWRHRAITRGDLARVGPFFFVAVSLVLVNLWFQTHGSGEVIRSAGLIERLLGAAAALWFYLSKAVLPTDLMFVYPRWEIDPRNIVWWLPLLGTVAVTALLWRHRATHWGRPLLFAWGLFCVTLLPVLGFVDVTYMKYSLVADHYQNVALIAVVGLVGAGWSAWFRSARNVGRVAAVSIAILVVAGGAGLTWKQCLMYRDPEALFRTTLEQNPRGWFAHTNLAKLLLKTGRPSEAIDHFRAALELAPGYIENYVNLGATLTATGQTQEAIPLLERAVEMAPDFLETQVDLAIALERAGRLQEAMAHAEEARRLEPDQPEPYSVLGSVLLDLQRPQEAIAPLEEAVRLKPAFVEAWTNLAVAYATAGRKPEAIAAATTALDAARAARLSELEQRIERWLAAYRAGQLEMPTREPDLPEPALPPTP